MTQRYAHLRPDHGAVWAQRLEGRRPDDAVLCNILGLHPGWHGDCATVLSRVAASLGLSATENETYHSRDNRDE